MDEIIDKDRYKQAIEKVLEEVPVEDGAIDVDSIWVETSLPKDLIIEILRETDLKLPKNVKKIVLKRKVKKGSVRDG
jgi:CxxC motif-containing protein